MRSPYTCLYREIWDDERFYEMSETGRLVYIYILSTTLGNGLGCFKAGVAAMTEESRLLPKRFKEGFKEGLGQGLFEYDEKKRVLLVPKYFSRNPPANPNGIKALSKEFVKIPDSALKAKCYLIVAGWVAKQKESFAEPFNELFAKPLSEPLLEQPGTISPSPSLTPSPSNTLSPSSSLLPPERGSGNNGKGRGVPVWKAYSEAYKLKYGVEPKRNGKANKMCCELVDRLGADEAPQVAAYYLQCRNSYHVGRGHSLQCLVGDAEKIRTEWATGRQVTQTGAREDDRLEKTKSNWLEVMDEMGE